MVKLTNDQWNRIIQALVTFIVTVCNVILVTSCTLAVSIQKQNSSSKQDIQQSASADSTNIKPTIEPWKK